MLFPAERACNRQLFILQCILRLANSRIHSVSARAKSTTTACLPGLKMAQHGLFVKSLDGRSSISAATTNNAFRGVHPARAYDKILY